MGTRLQRAALTPTGGEPLDVEGWSQIEILFHSALERPVEQRERYVTEHCKDAALRAQLLRMLAADADQSTYFESLLEEGASQLTTHLDAERVGSNIGPYRLTSWVGQGGMGAVYLAERADDQYDRKVAVKLVHAGPRSEALVQRLRHERQLLARLEHPNIARLYDGGATEDGLPYVVMEWIDGVPVTQFAMEQKLSLRERLALFAQICDAVQFAHRQLIVHRDLKPSNVLVDRSGTPRLLDFGIAHIEKESFENHSFEMSAVRAISPNYSSPEQMFNGAVSTSCDIYSLGVLLFELLSGQLPRTFSKDPVRWSESFEGEAPLASETLAQAEGDTRPHKLHPRQLRGDLDAILRRALDTDPDRRYRAVAELSQDLRNHLKHYPVSARPDAFSYRVGRWIQRHRWGVSAGVLGGLVSILVFASVWLQREQVRDARDRAESTSQLLLGMFEVADPRASGAGQLTIQELLDHGVRQSSELDGQPESQAVFLQTLAELYERIGDLDRAEMLFERAIELRRDQAGDLKAIATALHDLGRARARKGELEDASRLFAEGLRIRRQVHVGQHPDLASSLNALALSLHERGLYDEATVHYRDALEMDRATLGDDAIHTQIVRSNFALLMLDRGDDVAAERLFREVLERLDPESSGEARDQYAENLSGLGLALNGQERWTEAILCFEQAHELRREMFGDDHYLVARAMHHLGSALLGEGELDRAQPLLRQSLVMRERLLGSDHPEYAEGIRSLARMQGLNGDLEGARAGFARAASIYSESLGGEHPTVLATLRELDGLAQPGSIDLKKESSLGTPNSANPTMGAVMH